MRIERSEIVDYVTYKERRPVERPKIIEMKKPRRVHLGEYLTFLFENRATIKYQIQEMTLAEKIVKEDEIKHEIDTYNELFGEPGSFPVVLLVEIEDEEERKEKLEKWFDLPKTLYVVTENGEKVYANYDERQISDVKLSSVQYLYFNTKGVPITAIGTDLEYIKQEVKLTDVQKAALDADLKELNS